MFQLSFENQLVRNLSDFGPDLSNLPPFAKEAFTFCKEWLSGKEQFTQKTSGSTGQPKEIHLSRAQMVKSAKATGAFFQIKSNTKLLCCLSPEYIAGKMMLVRALVWDCPIWLVEPSSNPLKESDLVPDFIAMVPLQLESSLQDPDSLSKLKRITHILIGGAAVSERLKQNLHNTGILAWQTYGMTETVSHIALAKIGLGQLNYQPLPSVETGKDERGTLWVKSPMSGPDKIQTNDLIKLNSDNSFYWLGRIDFTVNSGGIKLHPELLEQKAEATISEFFPNSRFFFFGEKDEKLGQKLILIIETEERDEERARQLQDKLKSILGKYEVPKKIYLKRVFSLTPTGKIDRNLTYQSQ
jgi:O-succinylbenzoic acid--CoA ligase